MAKAQVPDVPLNSDNALHMSHQYCLVTVAWQAVGDLFNNGRDGIATEILVEQIFAINPAADRATMLNGRRFDERGKLEDWDLYNCNIFALPESFSALVCSRNLDLSRNQLQTLPASFHRIRVGGSINLNSNQLKELAPSFDQLKVGGNLYLGNNLLRSLPAMHALTVGGSLYLNNNQLHTLPPTIHNLKVGGHLYLNDNQLESLPLSFHLVGAPLVAAVL